MEDLDSNNLIGLYIAIPIYFLLLASASFIAYRHMNRLQIDARNDALSKHFLANRSFGPLISTGSLFASFFSGYTVVGVPNDAYNIGFLALRWCSAVVVISSIMFITVTKLRKTSLIRNHQSPADFITDRFESQVLRYTMVALQILPSIAYLTAQMVAIRTTFNGLFKVDPDSATAVVIISLIIVIFEWVGGLSSVAMTDSIQATIMTFCFIALPSVIFSNYGGWMSLDPNTYAKPEFYQTPSIQDQWMFWNFLAVFLGAFTLPQVLQRVYAADSMKTLKFSYTVLSFAPFLTMISGLFLGTVGLQFLADKGITNPVSPFSEIIEAVLDLGGFAYVIGILTSTSTLAAVMSTADSVLIGLSQLITTEFVRPILPNTKSERLASYGKIVSLVSAMIALLLSLYAGDSISAIVVVQYGISIQAVPFFIVGLWARKDSHEAHPWNLSISAVTGLFFLFLFQFGYNGKFPLNPGVISFVINCFMLIVLEACRRFLRLGSTEEIQINVENDFNKKLFDTPSWDRPNLTRFGTGRLNVQRMVKTMKGVKDIGDNLWFLLTMLLLSLMVTPITDPSMPPLDEDRNFIYPPNVIRGMPAWAFRTMIVTVFSGGILIISIQQLPDTLLSKEEQDCIQNELMTEGSMETKDTIRRKRFSKILPVEVLSK